MKKNIYYRLLFFPFIFFFTFSYLLAVKENDEFYEGWGWSSKLTIKLADHQELDFLEEHKALSKILKKDMKEFLESSDKRNRNVALIRLSLLIKKNEKYDHKLTNCFRNMISISGEGEETRKTDLISIKSRNKNKESELQEELSFISQAYKLEPKNFRLDMKFTQNHLNKRFLKGKKSNIAREIYDKFSETITVNTSEDLKKLIRIRDNLHDMHTHSEQKIIFFLDESIKCVPAYYDFTIKKLLDETIKDVEAFYLQNHNFFSSSLNEEIRMKNVKSFEGEVLKATSKNNTKELIEVIELTEKNDREDRKTELEQLQEQGRSTLKKLEDRLNFLKFLYTENYLKINYEEEKQEEKEEKKEENSKKKKQLSPNIQSPDIYERNAKDLKEIVENKTINSIKDYENTKDKLDLLRKGITKTKISDYEWIADLENALGALEKDENLEGIVFHLHSLNDICERCSPSIARELEREDGLINHLKSIIMAHPSYSFEKIKRNEFPMIRFTVSCDKIREECENRYKTQIFNNLLKEGPAFQQVLLKEAKAHRTLDEFNVKKGKIFDLPKQEQLTAFQQLLLKNEKAKTTLEKLGKTQH